jgi:hypothetical protein
LVPAQAGSAQRLLNGFVMRGSLTEFENLLNFG